MCFVDDGCYDWVVGEETKSIVLVTEPKRCHECRRLIGGELAFRIHQTEDIDFRDSDDFDNDGNLIGCPPEEWTGYVCGECDLTRFRIHLHELAEGCREDESWCPYGDLRDYCCESEFEKSSREDGAAWIFCGNHVDDSNGLLLLRSGRQFEDLNPCDLQLAAAAPEMLDALKECLEYIEEYDDGASGIMERVRFAIMKATE